MWVGGEHREGRQFLAACGISGMTVLRNPLAFPRYSVFWIGAPEALTLSDCAHDARRRR